jgi:hypothetical protein
LGKSTALAISVHSTYLVPASPYTYTSIEDQPLMLTTSAPTQATIEYPVLTINPFIKRIYRVDPRPPKERGLKEDDCEPDKPQLIWERGKDKSYKWSEVPWQCPYMK